MLGYIPSFAIAIIIAFEPYVDNVNPELCYLIYDKSNNFPHTLW